MKRKRFGRFTSMEPIGRTGLFLFIIGIGSSPPLLAQQSSSNITGKLSLVATVNLLQQAQKVTQAKGAVAAGLELESDSPEFGALRRREMGRVASSRSLRPPLRSLTFGLTINTVASLQSLPVNPAPSGFGFNGLTHADQRNANGGNQFSVEPGNPAIAVGEGFVLEGVNNAVQVYSPLGIALLPVPVSSNQLFGLAPAIDRKTGVNGVFPTDMRVLYDADIRRWIVFQRAQLNDAQGNPLNQSGEWMAVSQTADPIGTYNIYTRDTTTPTQTGCPCFADYPLLGADQFGLYISSNYFSTASGNFANAASIVAVSKASLASGAASPTAVEFVIPFITGFEFAIFPAAMPPGARSLATSNGAEYFVSSQSDCCTASSLAVWVASNTSSLQTSNPNLSLTFTAVPTQAYSFPPAGVTQHPGILPYGSSLTPPGLLPTIDGGDPRIQSVTYAGGRLYTALATQVTDESSRHLAGGAYFVLSRKLRGGLLALEVVRQGYLQVSNNNLLRSVMAVNAQGRGVVTFTLVGPDYYPSVAYVPIDTFTTGSAIQIVAAGVAPEDGFTGYRDSSGMLNPARWGDTSSAVASSDGSIWFSTEYIPDGVRTTLANWGTFIAQYRP